jgi:Zn-dependent protease
MPFLRFSRVGLNLNPLPDFDFAQIFLVFIVLLFSLTVHEAAHAWTADSLGDSTPRLQGRLSLNPLVHVDPVGTLLLPLVAMVTNLPVIGWAKPVMVNVNKLRHKRRDYVLVAAAGPASNLLLAVVAALLLKLIPISPVAHGETNITVPIASMLGRALYLNVFLCVFNLIPIPPLDGGNVIGGLLPAQLGRRFDAIVRPYGFILLLALVLSRGFDVLIIRPSTYLVSWLQ